MLKLTWNRSCDGIVFLFGCEAYWSGTASRIKKKRDGLLWELIGL